MSRIPPLVVGCDESGNDGENLLLGNTRVFTHASVAMPVASAEALMAEIRERTGSESIEIKSRTILQNRHKSVARWLLSHPDMRTFSSVLVTHKRYFLSTKLFDSTVEEVASARGFDLYASGLALSGVTLLHFLAPKLYGEAWEEVLNSFQFFLRAREAGGAIVALAKFSEALQGLPEQKESPLSMVHSMMLEGVTHLGSLSELQLGVGIASRLQTGDPLLSAIGSTVGYWYHREDRPIQVLHDETPILTPGQVSLIRQAFETAELIAPSIRSRRQEFAGLETRDSKDDPRIQVADILAGIAREVFEVANRGRQHPLLQEVMPLVSGETMWPNPDFMDPEEARRAMMEARLERGDPF